MIDLQYAAEQREDFFNLVEDSFDDGVYVCDECGECRVECREECRECREENFG